MTKPSPGLGPVGAMTMVDETELVARLARLFTDRLNVEVPASDTELFDTGILDSLRFVELLAVLEEAFGVRVAVNELEIDDFRTLSRIADFLAAKQLT